MKAPHSRRAAAYAAALTALALTPFTAQAQSSPDDVAALREQIRLLDQKLRVLERNIELKDETAAAEAKKLPKITASDGRFEIVSADGANSIRLRGLVQADARFYLDDANVAAGQDRFLLRRARLVFEGKFSERFNYVVQPEFGGGTVQLQDAYVNTAITPAVNVQVGRFKIPVGLEQLQADPVAFFNERSIATNLAPNRDVGVQLFGSVAKQRLSYQVSVTNGVIDGNNTAAGGGTNFEGDFTVAGRLFATPFVNDTDSALKGLGVGLAGATGNYDGAQLIAYNTDGQQPVFAYNTAGGTVAAGTATVLSPQAYYYYGPLGVLAEYFHSTTALANGTGASLNARELNNTAYNLSFGYVLTGEDAGYRGVTPKTVFNPSAGTWGAFEVVARISHLDIDDAAFFNPAGAPVALAGANNASEITSYGLGLNWYLSKSVRAGFDIFQSDFKLAPGAVVPASGSVLSDDETVFISRVQVSF